MWWWRAYTSLGSPKFLLQFHRLCGVWLPNVLMILAKHFYSFNNQTTIQQKYKMTYYRIRKQAIYGFYHILCCNMFVFACPIIAGSQCCLFALIRICPHISVCAPEFNFRYLPSGLKDYMSKYKERWCMQICIKSHFNQIDTFQNIGIYIKV
jgi:hypothetical protein